MSFSTWINPCPVSFLRNVLNVYHTEKRQVFISEDLSKIHQLLFLGYLITSSFFDFSRSRTKSKKLQYVILTLGWDGVKHLKHADCTWFAYYGWCRARDFLGFVDLVRTQIFPNKTSYPLSKFFRIKLLTPWYAHDIHDFSWPKI